MDVLKDKKHELLLIAQDSELMPLGYEHST